MDQDQAVRVAFFSEHASPLALRGGEDAGGQNVYVDEVSRNLVAHGYRVDIFTRRSSDDVPFIVDWATGVRVINLTAGPVEFLLKDALWPSMPAFCAAFLQFVNRSGEHYDLIHSNFWMSGWAACEVRRQLNLPVVHIFHAMGKTKRRHQGDDDTSPDERIQIEMQVIREVDRLIAQCPSEERELLDDYAADPRKVVVIPSAVNCDVFHPVARTEARRLVGLAEDDFVVVYVGRMLPRKDVRNVVRGVAEFIRWCRVRNPEMVPRIKLLLVGGEAEQPDPLLTPEIGVLQHMAAALDIAEHVRFVGKRQQDVLSNYYGAGDVVVTTPWYEPFGLTPLEGMACGRPVIGSAVGGITYTLADGVTGFLVPPRDPAALAQRLSQLLTHPEMCIQMGKASRARVEQEFTWSTVGLRTAGLYDQVRAEWRGSARGMRPSIASSASPVKLC
jgi:D-inositol-3-phosphate glycosyltransferase